jgi:hypothetical protein
MALGLGSGDELVVMIMIEVIVERARYEWTRRAGEGVS